ncbi:hypothetical protein H9Q72_011211 [Fusarium xylarioides]|uniref:Uncharacterized protein n=1 Tax=Fusarium xylarioides TaxID=221167 RepID=A0A9P7ICJ9_9HYPO|nr:hypothetical protein H9Q70_011487 [Fusarium xylarioides]KAG5760668.1 hypothetical protein H9Q72_011211 [Fusarium xylarioides]KAG5774745.1 hypothetical protein H9Q73_011574 [Fusarium xylarioides]KAG5805490.1 hypothetical protein H9Q71_009935 [Fusarium xylarioides]KAG5818625.1 hypothetical protein H9Q74_009970 [Fusarium xylarioides]
MPEDQDERKIPKAEDVWKIDTPYLDTAVMRARGVRISGLATSVGVGEEVPDGAIELGRFNETKVDPNHRYYWQPGLLIGYSPDERAAISHSPDFIPPTEMERKLTSATFCNHIEKYGRPEGISAGWGGYDRFLQWQRHGRHVKTAMVENETDHSSNLPSANIVMESTDQKLLVPTYDKHLQPSAKLMKAPTLLGKLKNSGYKGKDKAKKDGGRKQQARPTGHGQQEKNKDTGSENFW